MQEWHFLLLYLKNFNVMKKFMLDLVVKSNMALNSQYSLVVLTSDDKLPQMLPGQFVEVRIDDSPSTFLRRPISINFVDYESNELWLLIQIVGQGTLRMSKWKEGEIVNVILPLGNTFSYPTDLDSELILIGGGVGIAPLLFWGAELVHKGYKCNFLMGGRSEQNLLQLEDFAKYGSVYTTTEDGTHGEKGYVTQHSVLKSKQFSNIYTCGPTPMMKAVASYALINEIYCEVSLENTMACGIGTCLCCVTDSVDGNVCVCTEGPVFDIKRLKWQI
jgi:dihydroorotate dehydrogenase electron transfer subunit